jgi:hypothetical protein
MKKNILLASLAVLIMTATVSAQTQKVEVGGTTFGVRAGINFQNINGKYADGDRIKNDLVTRFHVGVNAEIPVAPEFYFQPGLLFTTKGTKGTEDFFGQQLEGKLNLSYLELPLNFLYKPVLGSGKLIVGLGPYVAYGIGGKLKLEAAGESGDMDVKFKNKVKNGDDMDKVYYKPFDAGANLLFGYEFSNRLSAQLNAQLGLVNINSKYDGVPEGDARSKNTGFGVSVGYRF